MKKQTVLFLNRNFYDYDLIIKGSLEKRGYEVIDYSIYPRLSLIKLFFINVFGKEIKSKEVKKHQEKIIQNLKEIKKQVDVIFLLSGQDILNSTLKQLKSLYPNAKFVWYMWDNTKNIAEFDNAKNYFDSIISFDKKEAEEIGLAYSPLFYVKQINTEKINDLCFIGSIHSDRLKIIDAILSLNIFSKCFLHIYATKKQYLSYILNSNHTLIKSLKLSKLSSKESLLEFSQSRFVLDITLSDQTGLSMRTFEAMGCHSRLITTNINIVNYDFYNENNIIILDKNNIEELKNVNWKSSYEEIDDKIMNYYSLENWIDRLIYYFD